jgi:hypothetical protein
MQRHDASRLNLHVAVTQAPFGQLHVLLREVDRRKLHLHHADGRGGSALQRIAARLVLRTFSGERRHRRGKRQQAGDDGDAGRADAIQFRCAHDGFSFMVGRDGCAAYAQSVDGSLEYRADRSRETGDDIACKVVESRCFAYGSVRNTIRRL